MVAAARYNYRGGLEPPIVITLSFETKYDY